jgi:hypothetical protein
LASASSAVCIRHGKQRASIPPWHFELKAKSEAAGEIYL